MLAPRKILIAKLGEIPVGRTKSFRYGIKNGIAYNDHGTIKAYVNVCTHMGGPVELVDGKQIFRCRWHQAEFDPKTGAAVEGQAPKNTFLQPIELVIEGDNIFGVLTFPEDPFA
jgi:nitrite reductase/ring-hydroxylating ferredoxin subunit